MYSSLQPIVLRRLWRSPLFTLVTIATLAIAIGANTAIFSVVHAVLLRPLPFAESQRLVEVFHIGFGDDELALAQDTYLVYRKRNHVFEDMALFQGGNANLTGGDVPEEVRSATVSASFFPLLRVVPELGRSFVEAYERPGGEPVVILSHELWQHRFGAQAEVVGEKIQVDATAHTVIGVLPAGFYFPGLDAELWLPVKIDPARPGTGSFQYRALGRLRPGVQLREATTELAALVAKVPEEYPESHLTPTLIEGGPVTAYARPLRDVVVGDVSGVLAVLWGSSGAILLIACANVANLFLARAEGRSQELAVRLAIGASPGDVARAFLAESTVLALAGAALGLDFAGVGMRALVKLGPQDIPRLGEITIDGPVLGFTLGISLLAALGIGVIPALRGMPNLAFGLKEGGRAATTGRHRHRVRHFLVVTQIALALVLLVISGLMVRSFRELRDVDPGFTPEGVLTINLSPAQVDYPDAISVVAFHQEVLERVRNLPGVEAAAGVSFLPLLEDRAVHSHLFEDFPLGPGEVPPFFTTRLVTPGYFETLGISVVSGRTFERADIETPRGAVVVNQALARHVWGDESPIGKCLAPESVGLGVWYTVVGVVADARESDPAATPAPSVYYPLLSRAAPGGRDVHPLRSVSLVVRGGLVPTSLSDAVASAVWEVDSSVPVARVRTLEEIMRTARARSAFTALLLLIAAAVAMSLGAVGLYGVIAYVVSLRTHEIGVRMALGADRARVSGMVLRQGLVVALVGVAVGLAGSLALTRQLESVLYEVSPTDPPTFAAVAILVVTVALLATYLAAHRAATIDPINALHHE